MESAVIKIIVGAAIGFVLKIIWDWLASGRSEKGSIYLKASDCEKHREKCCVIDLRKDYGSHKSDTRARLKTVEKNLDKGEENFKALRADITSIKESLAGIKIVLESFLKVKK